MTIIRDNKEIELTRKEMAEAYHEILHSWDKEEIVSALWDNDLDAAIREMGSEENLDDVIDKYRKYLDNAEDGDYRWNCMLDAKEYIKGR